MELNTNEHDPTLRRYDEAFLKYVNVSSIAAHTIFILITLGTLLLWFFRHRLQNWDQKRIMTSVKYSGETRTLFILTILVVHIFVEASVLLMSFRSSYWNWIIHAAQAAAICGTASCIAVCAVSLEAISIVYHCVILFYWSCCSALEILRLTQYVMVTELQFANSNVRIMFSSFLIVLYVALVVLEVVVLLYKKFSCCYMKNKRPKDDISLIRYTHSYSVFLSKLSLSWLSDLLRTGYRRYLCLEDLGRIVQRESTSFNFEKLKLIIQNEKNKSFVKNRPVSLWRCLWHMSKSMMLLSGACKLLSDVLVYVPPICLDVIVSYAVSESLHQQQNASQSSFNSSSVTENNGVLYISVQQFFTNGYVATLVCFLASLVLFLNAQHNYFISVREGIRCKCALQAAVYDKCLRLNVTSLNEGQIMNHVTVDVGRIVLFFNFAHYIWALPFEIIFGFLVLYAQLGVSALISGLIILLVVPLQYYLGLRLAAYQKLIMEQADERLLKSAELLQNIKLLKLYSWETLFYGFVDSIRKKELHFMYKAALVRMLSITFTDGVPFLACLVAFTLYYRLESEPLQPAKVFSSVALFANFATQLFIITLVINTASQARVSVIRLQEFLLLPELTKLHSSVAAKKRRSSETNGGQSPVIFSSDTAVLDEEKQPLQESSFVINPFHSSTAAASWDNTEMGDGLAVEITNGNFAWKTERILTDINIKIPRNQLTIIVGSIGSGKSSLIMAMLGEMEQSSGSVKTCSRSVAVVPQSCWVLNATVRENIIFGQPYNKERYEQVIEAASLEQDFKSFVNDDQTEIGEKGANLSGGQRQRIAIARALYADADIYYLDDSLSALDAHVGSHVFNNAIMKLLIKDRCKTVILVTHHTHLLPQADHLIVMKQGHIAYDGSIKHLMAEDPKLYESLTPIIFDNTHTASVSPVYCHAENTSLLQNSVQDFFDVTKLNHVAAPVTPSMSVTSLTSISHVFSSHLSQVDSKKGDDFDLGKLIEEEEMSSGSVPARIFIEFIKAAVWVTVVVTLSLYAMCQALHMTADYFLTEMVNCGTEIKFAEKSNDTVMVEHYWAQYSSLMRIFISLSIVCILLVPISSFCLQLSCLTAAKNLHNKTLRSIVAAPIQFFDRTPIGRILNRLSADMNRIDEILVSCIEALIFCTFYVLGGIVMNSVFVPYFIAPVIPLLVIFVVIQRYFIASSRELQRLDCVTRSPMMALLSQTLGGLSTIRAFRNEAQFQQKIWKRIDDNQLPFLFYHTTNIWMGIRLDILGAFIVLAASLASLTSCLYGHIDSGMVGLVIAYAIMISSFINWMMRGVSETEIQFNSVERIIEYSDLESEPYDKTHPASMSLDPDWPANGEIQIKAVSLKYNINQDPVVANLSLHIKPGQKIGICGRTGSGKSSLTMSLFRAVHISEGKILLDGVDITQVPLRTLRSKLSIIPQEPVLFSGTIRFNMDPTGRVCDEKIWSMLEIAQLKELISNLPKKLDTVVRDGGSIFSIGQKQLFCLARALLRESKVLIMDEATASIDIETDRAIQQIVQKACANRTVLMIAHRISTIQNCDVIVVLRNGRLIEEGSPHYLSSKADSAFAKMVADNKL